MSNSKDISEERINAFIDGELDATERNEIFEALGGDTALSQQVCELRQLSELVRHAYDRPPESALARRCRFVPDTAKATSPQRRAFVGIDT